MKKLLLILLFTVSLLSTKAQLALNELYVRPGNGQSEFFEIYNNAKTNININLDCISVLTYWKQGANRGWYVLDLPASAIPPGGYYSIASSSPFDIQGQTAVSANFNWNSVATDASIKSYQLNVGGTGYDAPTAVPANFNDFFQDLSGIGVKYVVLLFKQGIFLQGFLGGSGSNILPAEVIAMPSLTATTQGACTSEIYNFSGISGSPFLYNVNPATGNDNGYSRLYDGNCSPWDKSASGNEHTPNVTNNGTGGVSPYDGTITTSQFMRCLTQTSAEVVYNITGITGAATEGSAFPVKVEIFQDKTPGNPTDQPNGQYDPGVDILLTTNSVTSLTQGVNTFTITGSNSPAIVILYSTANGCYDKVFNDAAACALLPVDFKSFIATRNHANVLLKWETATEIKNSGFAVERNVKGNWEQIAFVPTQAAGGNSYDALTYTFNDLNATKGITQYRLRQVGMDAKSKYSEIRSVRGDGQPGKVTVYPNPTSDGRVNIVFEESNIARDIMVIDMSGRTVKQLKGTNSNNVTIDNLTSGMYSLQIVVPSTGEQTIQKIVVNKK
jgi:hypothetical protein